MSTKTIERRIVNRLAGEMRRRLRANSDRDWEPTRATAFVNTEWLLRRLHEEVAEFHTAVLTKPQDALGEAADAANFMAMIVDQVAKKGGKK